MTTYGVATDYDYSATHKRGRITVWKGPFMSTWVAEGYSLPSNNGYMLTDWNGKKYRVICPIRTDETFMEVDRIIGECLNAYLG